jgi:hypothetical protein
MHGLAHMDRDADSDVLFAVDLIANAFIKPNVLDKALISIEADTRLSKAPRQLFRMSQQKPTKSLPLEVRCDCEVLNQQLLVFVDSLY